ncbi:tyrosine-type recombinase/integrase [Shewanella aestuarii]|uniref:Tyrosine-type recombinase/integrase n=1 Tax=Shewanella aestuarii TaxID=1028752 RepID=A0A6G9QPI9_9GAMM|nr:tyrosine-type recombinase/integrase [Shewanella aestuarii]QIR16392.1 tyrosine-type recombinase/integrase [Shewanella aestuarii]
MNSNLPILPGITGLATAQDIAPKSIAESLLDDRSILEKRLKLQLERPIDEVDNQEIRRLISSLLADFANNDSQLSENTLKALFINWAIFEQWCNDKQVISLPSSSQNFIQFINEKKSLVKMNTLSQYRWAVSKIHLAAGLPSPSHTQKAIDIVTGIRKNKVISSELVDQAQPFREVHCDAIFELWRHDPNPLISRNLAILVTAYETMLRESELARIELSHLTYHEDGRATLLIPFTKSRKSGEPDTTMLSRQCVDTIRKYLSLDVNDSVYLFKKMRRNGKPTSQNQAISRYTIDRVFKQAYDCLSLNRPELLEGISLWSGHSARVGACQDLLSAGYSTLEVQQAGRWTSGQMVFQYGRNILAKESAMAKARWNK